MEVGSNGHYILNGEDYEIVYIFSNAASAYIY